MAVYRIGNNPFISFPTMKSRLRRKLEVLIMTAVFGHSGAVDSGTNCGYRAGDIEKSILIFVRSIRPERFRRLAYLRCITAEIGRAHV